MIQPTHVDLEQAVWRRLVDFMRSVDTRTIEPAAIRDAVAGDRISGSATDVTREAFGTRLRTEFDLPQPIGDERAELSVEAAITAISEDDFDTAATRLEETLETVCRREVPESVAVGGDIGTEDASLAVNRSPSEANPVDHRVACHLFDPELSKNGDSRAEK